MTKYEKAIYEIIDHSRDHLTADQVLAALREQYPAVSQATVYNNLKKLCEEGLVRRLSFAGERDRYDHIQRHDHLICQRCGRLADVTFEDLTAPLRTQLGENIVSYDLKVFYICPECQKKAQDDNNQ